MRKKVATVLPFTPGTPSKFGFQRVRRKEKEGGPKPGQLNLFSGTGAQVLKFPGQVGPFEEALLLDEQGSERAEEVYRRAISEGDSVADAYCNLGIIQSTGGETARAFDSFTKSLEHDPRHFESHYNLGNLYFEQGDLRVARMHYEMALEVFPDFPNLYFNLGLVLASQSEFLRAIDAFRKYQKLVPREEARKADDILATLERSLDKGGS
jgi:tetratricopeptide (TPR) repeat protein